MYFHQPEPNPFAQVLLAMLIIGWRTKLSAVALLIFLMAENITLNDFFVHDEADSMYDYKKFNFFQGCTVVSSFHSLDCYMCFYLFVAKMYLLQSFRNKQIGALQVGGLMMLIALGPGSVSFDGDSKKAR